jgi:CRP-like cAMP-binding protein
MSHPNHFLDGLAPATFGLIRDDLQRVALKRDEKVVEAGRPVDLVVLPVDCIISVTTVMADGKQVESRTIGREGGFGLLHAIGSPTSFERVIVQIGGDAMVIRRGALRAAARQSPDLTEAIVRHAQATLVQSAQFMACNTLHDVRPRLCRWLLMTQDRLGGAEVLPLTQEHLSIMLGVQRTTVTLIARGLQDQGLISYMRGKIRIKDRERLTRCACECYAALTHSTERILEHALT